MIYYNDNLRVDTKLYRLERDGESVEIEPQVFDLLVYLIEHRDRVVGRAELLDALWRGRVVSDSALSARLKVVRRVVGDSGATQRVIKTIHGRGYQFVAAVNEDLEQAPHSTGGDTGPLPEPFQKPSIALLPFSNMSGEPEQDYFADGLTEDIITALSRYRDLFVIASNSSFAYKKKAIKVQDASRELGARFILEGSVQKSEDRVRISVQLIDGRGGEHLWAERYDRHLDDIFKVQDEVTETIVATLASGYGGRLRKAWQQQMPGTRAQNALAFDCFMRGLDALNKFTKQSNQRGREYLEQATKLDPGYAKAFGKLAWTHLLDAILGWSDDYDKSLAAGFKFARLGIERDDGESWSHWALGAYHFYVGKQDLGIAEFERAVELNPNDADVLADYGYYLSYAGRAEDGLYYQLKAMQLNPHHPEYYKYQLGQIYFDARQYEKAVAILDGLQDVADTLMALYMGASYAALDHLDEAAVCVQQLLQLDPEATVTKWTDPKMAPYKKLQDLEHFRRNLYKAGLTN